MLYLAVSPYAGHSVQAPHALGWVTLKNGES